MSTKGSFSVQVEKWIKATQQKSDEICRKIALGILSNVVVGSPVDTGRFRGNWQVGLDTRPVGTLDVVSRGASSVVRREGAKLKAFAAGGRLYITNNLPYARRLEFGWSKQAPAGMVRVTLANLDQIVSEAVKE